jgi:hypothetical protein
MNAGQIVFDARFIVRIDAYAKKAKVVVVKYLPIGKHIG